MNETNTKIGVFFFFFFHLRKLKDIDDKREQEKRLA